jgi:hypothetical protein
MSPAEYVSKIVLPTVEEYLAAMDDPRRAMLACIATYHVRDYLAQALGERVGAIDQRLQNVCGHFFDVIEGMCNGSKHGGNSRGNFHFTPGDEERIPATGYGVGGGWGSFRWGGAPGLVVAHRASSDLSRLLPIRCPRLPWPPFPRSIHRSRSREVRRPLSKMKRCADRSSASPIAAIGLVGQWCGPRWRKAGRDRGDSCNGPV